MYISSMTMTRKQRLRQKARENGKYVIMHVCEACGKHIGADYYSALDCNETGFGLVLCKKCVEKK
jgi:hypothetical protein